MKRHQGNQQQPTNACKCCQAGRTCDATSRYSDIPNGPDIASIRSLSVSERHIVMGACNFLDITELLRLCAKYEAQQIRTLKSEQEVCEYYNITYPFTFDEKKEILKMYFGIGKDYPIKQKEIATKFKSSKVYIRKIKDNILKIARIELS